MKSARPYKTRNFNTLKCIASNIPFIKPFVGDIFRSYKVYAVNSGSPKILRPMVTDSTQKIEFRRLMEDCYDSARVRDSLPWIKTYRENHGHASCPMCGAMHARSIEHYLPKAVYPEYAVFSLNLVPSCITCNQHRSNSANHVGTNLPMLHPFYDKPYINEKLLFAVNVGSYDAPKFMPSTYHTDREFRRRIGNHVKLSIDQPQFHTWALDRWGHIRSLAAREASFSKLTDALKVQLRDEEVLTGPNNWTAALIRGVLRDPEALIWLVDNPIIV